jgi:hypothetical protein
MNQSTRCDCTAPGGVDTRCCCIGLTGPSVVLGTPPLIPAPNSPFLSLSLSRRSRRTGPVRTQPLIKWLQPLRTQSLNNNNNNNNTTLLIKLFVTAAPILKGGAFCNLFGCTCDTINGFTVGSAIARYNQAPFSRAGFLPSTGFTHLRLPVDLNHHTAVWSHSRTLQAPTSSSMRTPSLSPTDSFHRG